MSPLDKAQWISVVRNSVFAFLAVAVPLLLTTNDYSQSALKAIAVAGIMAALKVVEKVFTPVA